MRQHEEVQAAIMTRRPELLVGLRARLRQRVDVEGDDVVKEDIALLINGIEFLINENQVLNAQNNSIQDQLKNLERSARGLYGLAGQIRREAMNPRLDHLGNRVEIDPEEPLDDEA